MLFYNDKKVFTILVTIFQHQDRNINNSQK